MDYRHLHVRRRRRGCAPDLLNVFTDDGEIFEVETDSDKGSKMPLAIVFGLIFGFLLQKGGVGKYAVIEGQLLFQDFTVVRVMLSAVLVGMIGIYFLHKNANTKLHIEPTQVGANIIGGLVFGAGFACAGYCPGTGAAALGQGDIFAGIFVAGMIVGSYIYAEASAFLNKTVKSWGDKGKITIPQVLHIKSGIVITACTLLFVGILLSLSKVQ